MGVTHNSDNNPATFSAMPMADGLAAEIRRLVDEGLGQAELWTAVQETDAWREAKRSGQPSGRSTVLAYAASIRPQQPRLTDDALDLLEEMAAGGASSLGHIGNLLRVAMDSLTELGIEIGRNEHRWERVSELVETLRASTRPHF